MKRRRLIQTFSLGYGRPRVISSIYIDIFAPDQNGTRQTWQWGFSPTRRVRADLLVERMMRALRLAGGERCEEWSNEAGTVVSVIRTYESRPGGRHEVGESVRLSRIYPDAATARRLSRTLIDLARFAAQRRWDDARNLALVIG